MGGRLGGTCLCQYGDSGVDGDAMGMVCSLKELWLAVIRMKPRDKRACDVGNESCEPRPYYDSFFTTMSLYIIIIPAHNFCS